MKRFLALLLALVTALALAACGRTAETAEPAETAEAETAPEYTAQTENELCRVAVAAPVEGEMEYDVSIQLENRSDAPMRFIVDARGYNGWYLLNEPFGAFETGEPGQTLESSFPIDKLRLADYGIEHIDSLDFVVRAFPENGTENTLDGVLTLNLTDGAQPAKRLAIEHEQTLFDENGVRVTIGNPVFTDDSCRVMLCCENSTDAELELSMQNFTYNGKVDSVYDSFRLPAHVKGYAILWADPYVLEQLGVAAEDLTEYGFDLKLQDWNDLSVLNEQTVTYNMR